MLGGSNISLVMERRIDSRSQSGAVYSNATESNLGGLYGRFTLIEVNCGLSGRLSFEMRDDLRGVDDC